MGRIIYALSNQPFHYKFNTAINLKIKWLKVSQALIQSISLRFNGVLGSNPESIEVLFLAPTGNTGKAAFHIGGVTIHGALVIPLREFAKLMSCLSDNVLNSLCVKLKDIKLIIIDEVSMVGLTFRLMQIFNSPLPFGGKSIILFGDFYQLPPVKKSFAFEINESQDNERLCGNTLNEVMRQKDDCKFAECL